MLCVDVDALLTRSAIMLVVARVCGQIFDGSTDTQRVRTANFVLEEALTTCAASTSLANLAVRRHVTCDCRYRAVVAVEGAADAGRTIGTDLHI